MVGLSRALFLIGRIDRHVSEILLNALSLCFAPPLALRLGHPLALALAQRGLASFLLSYDYLKLTAILDH